MRVRDTESNVLTQDRFGLRVLAERTAHLCQHSAINIRTPAPATIARLFSALGKDQISPLPLTSGKCYLCLGGTLQMEVTGKLARLQITHQSLKKGQPIEQVPANDLGLVDSRLGELALHLSQYRSGVPKPHHRHSGNCQDAEARDIVSEPIGFLGRLLD